ncbi:uncharacterized protein [Typha latifolia]|uniref:uncharacterized protein n=1 Tax=Typha latifolia TaxID=4733 RepID=UPI003C30C43E
MALLLPTFSPKSSPRNTNSKSIKNQQRRPFLIPLCSSISSSQVPDEPKKISKQSSWESKDAEGNDYLYRLGKESDNMNISVGARKGVIDDLFVGEFLGKDSDIVFDYRQKATRSFEYLKGDYYIAPVFLIERYRLRAGQFSTAKVAAAISHNTPGGLFMDGRRHKI